MAPGWNGLPLFDSWDIASLNNEDWEVIPHMSDDVHKDDDEVPSQVEQTPEPPVIAASQQSEIWITSGSGQLSIVCGHVPDSKKQQAGTSLATDSLLKELFSGSETDQSTNQPPLDFVCGQVPHSNQQQAGTSSATDSLTIQRPERKRKLKLKLKTICQQRENRNTRAKCLPSKRFSASITVTEERKGKRKGLQAT